jgi:hypothetical protein
MPKLRNMLGETGTVEIPVPDDDPLIVTYRRGVLTPRLQIKLLTLQGRMQGAGGKAPADPEALSTMVEVFANLIESWNLTDDEGQMIPTTAEALQDVDMSILTLVMQEIGRAVGPDPLSESGSSNGSTPGADPEPRPITTAS